MVQTVMRLPTMGETWVQSLGWEDPLGQNLLKLIVTLESGRRASTDSRVRPELKFWPFHC